MGASPFEGVRKQRFSDSTSAPSPVHGYIQNLELIRHQPTADIARDGVRTVAACLPSRLDFRALCRRVV
ncbi:hypothetical protein DSTSK_16940 [Desulforhabdus sp. TSK]|nr:hypothetical protein DSTSK_16940 [Desulforhabdus sp. TSK]